MKSPSPPGEGWGERSEGAEGGKGFASNLNSYQYITIIFSPYATPIALTRARNNGTRSAPRVIRVSFMSKRQDQPQPVVNPGNNPSRQHLDTMRQQFTVYRQHLRDVND